MPMRKPEDLHEVKADGYWRKSLFWHCRKTDCGSFAAVFLFVESVDQKNYRRLRQMILITKERRKGLEKNECSMV